MLRNTFALTALSIVLVNCGSGDFNAPERSDARPGSVTQAVSGGARSLVAGWSTACSIFDGGKIVCWGDNTWGQLGNGTTVQATKPTLVSGITTAVSVGTIGATSCAVLSDGTVKCWGANSLGQLGNGTTTSSNVPVTVSGINSATAIAVGGRHVCARLSNGTVKCWGNNDQGQLGQGYAGSYSTTPLTVSGLSNISLIVAGAEHVCTADSGGILKCWGRGSDGQIGDNGATQRNSPTTSGSGVVTLAGGWYHTCASTSANTAYCWGRNAHGQIGDNTTTQKNTPTLVALNVVDMAAGNEHTCAKLTDGTAKCWGANNSGQLGNGTTTEVRVPYPVSSLSSVIEIAVGLDFSCASVSGGGLKCWGPNSLGELNVGTSLVNTVPVSTHYNILNRVTQHADGGDFVCALWDTGAVKCWGTNTYGQLGNGTTTDSATPVDVSGITTAVEVKAGFSHACARLSDGTLKCWGRDTYGQLGNGGSETFSSSPVTVTGISTATSLGLGPAHSCAVLSDGTAKCWGRNRVGQLGNASGTDSTTPVTASGLTGAVSIAAGGNEYNSDANIEGGHTCAVLSTGAAKCWGKNNYGQLGTNANFFGIPLDANVPTAVDTLSSGVTQIATGLYHTCAVLGTGAMKCWGRNNYGQLGNGVTSSGVTNSPASVSGISTATMASGGNGFSCARLDDKTVKCWGYNFAGTLGTGSRFDALTPTAAVGVTRAMSISSGLANTCVRNDDSTLTCWGFDLSEYSYAGFYNHMTPASSACSAPDVARTDYFVSYTTTSMPDSQFNGLSAQIDTHRVKPVMFPASCTPQKAVILAHGRTVEAVSAFDLQYQDYSIMEQLARTGIDTYTFNQLGMGKSKIPSVDPFADSCNASLPACLDIGQTCPPPVGVLCDCGPVPTFGVNDKNQQGSTRYLNPNPRTSTCAHTTNTRFTTSTTMDQDLDVVINDSLSKSGLSKVSLLGYSAGGPIVGNYLSVADNTLRAARSAKVDKAIFVSSLFGSPQLTDTEPSGGSNVHSFPMGVMDRASATGGGFNLDLVNCPGQRDDGIIDPIWQSVKARDTVASAWGPSQTPSQNSGLSRFPHATRWGWTPTSAGRITVPVLVMQGLRDNVVPVAASSNLYAALTGTSSKTIVQVGCASHSIFWEGCSGSQCKGWTGPHFTLFKNARDWINTGMIYASPGSTNGAFESASDDGANAHTANPTDTGPDADESNQLP